MLNLVEILKNCPKRTKLYSPIYGEVMYLYIDNDSNYPIVAESDADCNVSFTLDGRLDANYDGECMLFPSKENRDWSAFNIFKKEYQLKPFAKVLVRDSDDEPWHLNLFSHIVGTSYKHVCLVNAWTQCIPYEGNEHLLGVIKNIE